MTTFTNQLLLLSLMTIQQMDKMKKNDKMPKIHFFQISGMKKDSPHHTIEAGRKSRKCARRKICLPLYHVFYDNCAGGF